MTEAERLLARQAQWQQSRRTLSWPEKIRQAERLRPSVKAFERLRNSPRADPGEGEPPTEPQR